jgi:diguanylate cyclase (GGDEF)-like protein
MPVDSYTILLSGVFIKALLCALFFVFWLYDRRATCFIWWSAAYGLGTLAAAIFLLRGFAGEMFAIGAGVAALVAAFSSIWQGARAFDGRRPLWLMFIGAPCLWLLICLVPGFLEDLRARVLVSSLMIAPLIAMSALEFWRGRDEPLLSRWPVIVLFSSLALLFASRIVLIDLLPFPFGALPVQPAWIGLFNLIVFFHALILTVLMVAIAKERLELDQRQKAQTDPLTGALNRRAFMSRGGRLLTRHQYDKAPLCLMFLDLDHFKQLNDRYGHSGGDDVLMKFVAIVHDNIRPTDFLFRYGGEEFCCLLPHTRAEEAHRVAERIRHRFETTVVNVAGVPVKATVSLGIASTEMFGYDLDTLIRRADMAVYAAKRAGRNRVVVATGREAVAGGATVMNGGTVGAA